MCLEHRVYFQHDQAARGDIYIGLGESNYKSLFMLEPTEYVDISSDDIAVEAVGGKEHLRTLHTQTVAIQSLLQNERCARFFDGESVYNYRITDAVESAPLDIILPERHLEQIENVNDHQWQFTYEGLVESYERTRWLGRDDGEISRNGRMTREESVDWYEGVNEVNGSRIELETDDMTTFTVNGFEHVEIHLPKGVSIVLRSEQPIREHVERFDAASLVHFTDEQIREWKHLGNEPAGNLILGFYPRDTPRMYVNETPDEETYANHVALLRDADSLTDPGVETLLSEVITTGYYTGDMVAKFAAILTGVEDRVHIQYGYHAPLIIDEFIRLVGGDVTHIPQDGTIILATDTCVSDVNQFSDSFPEKQVLDDSEYREIVSVLNAPIWATKLQDYRDEYKAYEVFATMFEEDVFDERDALAYYVACGFWYPKPDESSVRRAVEYGNTVIKALQKYDSQHSTNYSDCLKWPRGKVFSDVEKYYWRN